MFTEGIIELYAEHTSLLGDNLISSPNACTNILSRICADGIRRFTVSMHAVLSKEL